MGIIKSGKVVVVLAGRFAGRKAVVVKASDEASASKKYGHALVAGINRYPRKVVRAMSAKKVEKRTKVKPFIKVYNYSHILPTRYTVDFDLKTIVNEANLAEDKRVDARKAVKKVFEEKYRNQTGKADKKAVSAQYFFSKLRF